MGALSHYLEREGLPTTQISLIRLHSEKIRPPRALWVPFELGRPLGVPGDPSFQRRVLTATLKLLEYPSGPILEDYQEEAWPQSEEATVWACPIDLPVVEEDLTEAELLRKAFLREVGQMATWYQAAKQKRGRTTYGASGLEPMAAAEFVASFLDGTPPQNPRKDLSLPSLAKLASEDLKVFYFEAATAQPGDKADSGELNDWFFGETVAGRVFLRLKQIFEHSQDPETQMVGKLLLLPASQAGRNLDGLAVKESESAPRKL